MRIFLLFLISLSATADQVGTVWARYPASVREFFPAEQFKVLDHAAEEKENRDSGYLTPRAREALFQKLKLEDSLKNFDDMDKDMLVMGARFEDLQALKKHYPMLTNDQLTQLKRELAELSTP